MILPNEILFDIVSYLTTSRDINALVRVNRQCYECLNFLLYRHNVKQHEASGFMFAVHEGNIAAARMFLEQGADPDRETYIWSYIPRTPLTLAANLGCKDIVELCLTVGQANPNYSRGYDGPPLISAMKGIRDELQRLPMIDRNNQVQMNAAVGGQVETAFMLIEMDSVDLNGRDWRQATPLMFAARAGHAGLLGTLLNNPKVDVQVLDEFGNSPLYYAALGGSVECVKMILAVDELDSQARNARIRDALATAAGDGHIAVVKHLIYAEGADPNHTDKESSTLLYLAIKDEDMTTLRTLLEIDAVDPNIRDESSGETPLTFAVTRNAIDFVKEIVRCERVDVNAPNRSGETAIDLAVSSGENAIVHALLATGRVDPNFSRLRFQSTVELAHRNCSKQIQSDLKEYQIWWNREHPRSFKG